jgi:hypothetical protein
MGVEDLLIVIIWLMWSVYLSTTVISYKAALHLYKNRTWSLQVGHVALGTLGLKIAASKEPVLAVLASKEPVLDDWTGTATATVGATAGFGTWAWKLLLVPTFLAPKLTFFPPKWMNWKELICGGENAPFANATMTKQKIDKAKLRFVPLILEPEKVEKSLRREYYLLHMPTFF